MHRHFCAVFLFLISFPYQLLASPEHSITSFFNSPTQLFFFRDSTSAVYHDSIEGNIYVSSNEGRTWTLPEDIPRGVAAMVIEHPFDASLAFVLTRSTVHFRTEDRGKSWRMFQVPIPPAIVAAPLSFHSDPQNSGYILFQGTACNKIGRGSVCYDETYVTKDAFNSPPLLLLSDTSHCQFAHSGYNFKPAVHSDLVYCVAFDTKSSGDEHELSSSRLFSSRDFFNQEKNVEELGIGKNARGVIGIAIVSNFALVALEDPSDPRQGAVSLFVTASLALDVVHDHWSGDIGTLFVSDSNGTFFVQSLANTNRDEMGFVDYKPVYGAVGFGIANVVTNADYVEGRGDPKQLQTVITVDNGASWAPIPAPPTHSALRCNPDTESCFLHLHPATAPQYSSSLAPGVLFAVGSFGHSLLPYKDCDTFLSTDGGVTWGMIRLGPHKLSFADSGSILLAVPDEEGVSGLHYSWDSGKNWEFYDFGLRLRPLELHASDSPASPKFILLGQVARMDQSNTVGPYVVCTDDDFESCECIMGCKPGCYVGQRCTEPWSIPMCTCTDTDYECDYNYVREGMNTPMQSFMGSSGYRKVPGNVCTGGAKDHKVAKPCGAFPVEGVVLHSEFRFANHIQQYAYLPQSTTILVRLTDHSIWQSSNEGYSRNQLFPTEYFMTFYLHPYAPDTWDSIFTPTPPNTFRAKVLRFHPDADKLIWIGNNGCDTLLSRNCNAEAHYSRDNGRKWTFVENYVVNCAWLRNIRLWADHTAIVCESYQNKTGSQRYFHVENPLALVVGFAKFSEYWLVAELLPEKHSLELQVSLSGPFTTARFPAELHPSSHAYTVLESVTESLFIHVTTSEPPHPYWGTLIKSNSNGIFFGKSISNVNCNDHGFVDFEKIIGLDGIALVNVVVNPDEAILTGTKVLQTRITHTDGGTWKPLTPPSLDSDGNRYKCRNTACTLHLHGYTTRSTPEVTYSSWTIIGVIIAVGNSDTFLSRDAGLTWEEVRKDPHIWQFGDSGSILVMVQDGTATNHVLFSTDEGLNWREYQFSDKKMHVRSIVTIPYATSRRFILIGNQCIINIENPGQDDFELWNPTDGYQEKCLFGRQTLYHRRVRDLNCVVGDQLLHLPHIERNCACVKTDFECDFNYYKNEADECVLIPEAIPLPNDNSCNDGEDYWYERTAYRKISYSSCVGGERLDQGIQHKCATNIPIQRNGSSLWILVAIWIMIFVLLVAYCVITVVQPRGEY
ncbi:vacuolar protein sorting/targeting protein 10 [Mycena leptocephala]|nr:vacuolar protein sorting/targeting protein 10 [Mycena leptocephala]